MKLLATAVAFFVFFFPLLAVRHQFLSSDEQQKLLKSVDIPLPTCQAGSYIPIEAEFTPEGKAKKAHLWGGTRSGWLHTKAAADAIRRAVEWVKKAILPIKGESVETIIRVPCNN